MARVSTYLNFPRSTEAAFEFYRAVFGTEFSSPIARFREIPPQPDQPPLADADADLVMHVELPILGGHVLMGTDAPESMGFTLTPGNNVYINLEPDTRPETDRLFAALADGGSVEMPLQEISGAGTSAAWSTASASAGCSTAPASGDRAPGAVTHTRLSRVGPVTPSSAAVRVRCAIRGGSRCS
jgi:PhnB protein